VECVVDVPKLEDIDEDHAIGDFTMGVVLVSHEGKVQNWPEDYAGSEFAKDFDVKAADTWVERAAEKPLYFG